jgi:soluble lytic murein transglycosylase-like protein
MAEPTETSQPDGTTRRSRRKAERRKVRSAGRRGARLSPRQELLLAIVRDVAIAVLLLAVIVFAVDRGRPIFAGQPKVAERLAQRVPAAKVLTLPPAPPHDTGKLAAEERSPQFEADRKAFAEDLLRTGRMSRARADSIAYYAVREAYKRGIPPAVIFGVMLTENALFVSNALSNVGAVGLMQVYPKIWLKELSDRFGRDLAVDSTNVKYGVYILSSYIKPRKGSTTVTPQDVQRGLLRYNGCVTGSNTPHCHTYPTKVKNFVERQAESLCGDRSFYDCITRPYLDGLLGRREAGGS